MIYVLLLILALLIVAASVSIWRLKYLRDKEHISAEFFRQVSSSIISGLIVGLITSLASFLSAYSLWQIQDRKQENERIKLEEQKIADLRTDSLISIGNEISANRLDLQLEAGRGKRLMRSFLKTEEWENGKNYLSFQTPYLRGGLKILYYEIEDYNNLVSFLNFKTMEKNLTIEKMPEEAWESLKNSDEDLINKLKIFEKLVSRELVLQKQESKQEYEKQYGKWQEEVEVPYFSKKAEENKSP